MEEGVDIDGYHTRPCKISLNNSKEGTITLREGKFHQIKRMMEACHNQIVYLERIAFGGIALDEKLERGQWRYLTAKEQEQLEKHGSSNILENANVADGTNTSD